MGSGLWAGCAATVDRKFPDAADGEPGGESRWGLDGDDDWAKWSIAIAPLSAAAAVAGDTAVSVTNLAALNVAPDDLLLIIEMQGAQIRSTDDDQFGSVQSLQGAGLYELG